MMHHQENAMKRPTIADLAKASGVSISTVNRILGGASGVRPATIQLVQDAAAELNFYGRGAIEARRLETIPKYRLGFLLQQRSREIYRVFGESLVTASKTQEGAKITPLVEFAEDLAPENIARHLRLMGETCHAVALIAGDHPLIGQAITELKEKGVPVVTYITDQSAPVRGGYVGTDNWKLGRSAAWFIARAAQNRGRVGMFIGNYRYQCQDVADASFRSYMREHAPDIVLEETRATHEEPRIAYQMVKELLTRESDLVGIFMGGGGISGTLQALREEPEEARRNVSVVCRDIGPETRKGLTEGLITAALCLPLETASDSLVETMIDAIQARNNTTVLQRAVPFEIVIPESI